MKKYIITLLLGIFAVSLAGCNKAVADPSATPAPTGIIDKVASGTVSPGTSTEPSEALPTPTPEGNYVAFSVDSGFYESTQSVALSCNVEGAEIFYTLDGSTPNRTSTLYKTAIRVSRKLYAENVLAAQTGISAGNLYIPNFSVEKGTVIRAIAYLPDGSATPVAHASYFIGLKQDYGNVPVISLITDFDNLYDYETGIYVLGKTHDDWLADDPANASRESWEMVGNYSNRGREWERPVSVELITQDGSVGFKQNMGLRIMGGASRNQTQKSLKLYAREEYEAKNLKYDLIPNNYDKNGEFIDKYKTFVLRVGGNDADSARLRDPYLQTLVQDARFETQQSTPCVVFLNGEYWGMYTINEDYTDNHIQNNYGVDNKNVILIKRGELEEGEEDDLKLYHAMYNYITGADMSDPEIYKVACELVDMGSFIDFFAFQLYIYNQDGIFQDNNWRMWRVRDVDTSNDYADGKWRFAVYDTDFSTGIYDGPALASYDNLSEVIALPSEEDREDDAKHYRPIELFRSLLENETFREELILALCDMRNIYFEQTHAVRVLNEMAEPYRTLMPDTWKRFGPDWIAIYDPAGHFETKLTDLRSFIAKRYNSMPSLIRSAFDLGPMKKLNLSVNDQSMGTILVNGRQTDLSSGFSGLYFEETTVTLTAVPAEGYKFTGWEVKGGKLEDTKSKTIRFNLNSGLTATAIFEKQ